MSRCGRAWARPPPSASTGISAGTTPCDACTRPTRKRSMTSAAAVRLRCPDCGKDLGALAAGIACPGCARTFASDDGVWDLRPAALGAAQTAEDALHAEP